MLIRTLQERKLIRSGLPDTRNALGPEPSRGNRKSNELFFSVLFPRAGPNINRVRRDVEHTPRGSQYACSLTIKPLICEVTRGHRVQRHTVIEIKLRLGEVVLERLEQYVETRLP